MGCRDPSEINSLVSEGEPGLKLAVVVVEMVSLLIVSKSCLYSSLFLSIIISSSMIFSRWAFPFETFAFESLTVGEWTLGNSSSPVKPRSISSRFISSNLLCCLVVKHPVSVSRSNLCPDLERVSWVWMYSFRSSSSFLETTLLRQMRNMPREVANIPVATSSFHQPPSRQVTTSSGRMPEAMRKRPRTKNTMPRWSMPMEVLRRWSGGALDGVPLGLWSRLLWLVCGEEKRRSLSLLRRLSSRTLRCRLMANAEWSPTLPCMIPATRISHHFTISSQSSMIYFTCTLYSTS